MVYCERSVTTAVGLKGKTELLWSVNKSKPLFLLKTRAFTRRFPLCCMHLSPMLTMAALHPWNDRIRMKGAHEVDLKRVRFDQWQEFVSPHRTTGNLKHHWTHIVACIRPNVQVWFAVVMIFFICQRYFRECNSNWDWLNSLFLLPFDSFAGSFIIFFQKH